MSGLAVRNRPGAAVVVWSMLALAADVLVAVLAGVDWWAFDDAPNNAFVVPTDDPGYFAASAVYLLVSAARFVVLGGLVVAVVRGRTRPVRTVPGRWIFAIGFAGAVEVAAIALAAMQDEPTPAWMATRIAACVINAALVAAILCRLRRRNDESCT